MKKYIIALTALFISSTAFSQVSYYIVTGKIIDKETKAPLQAASVFAENTTIGTATDADGNFKIYLPYGGYDLVITFTGYQTETKRVTTADGDNKNIVIEIARKQKELEDVVVKGNNEVKDGWDKYGDFFLENFIGKTVNSKLCTIKNKDVLHFYFSKKRNRLKVLAAEPVLIENLALGYNIKYTMDSFTHEYNSAATVYSGYPLFEEMVSTDESQKVNWLASRKIAYNGSVLHFMRSLYNKQLKEEGFEIQFLIKVNNKDSGFVLKNFYAALNYNKDDSTQTVEVMPNQPDVAVIYKNEEPQAAYAAFNPDESAKFQLSVFSFVPAQPIIIEQNGYYFEQTDFTINQYLGWEKMADMLPYDFKVL